MTTPSPQPASPSAAVGADSAPSRWTIAIFALVGLGIGLLVFAFRTPTYESEALVAISNPVGSIQDEVAVATGPTVMTAATSTLGFEPDISVTAAEVASLLTITAKADDAQRAADAANTVAATYVQAQLGAAANVAQQATPATDPSGIGSLIYAILGSILGAIAGVAVAFMQRFRAPTDSVAPPATLPDTASQGAPAETLTAPATASPAPPAAGPTIVDSAAELGLTPDADVDELPGDELAPAQTFDAPQAPTPAPLQTAPPRPANPQPGSPQTAPLQTAPLQPTEQQLMPQITTSEDHGGGSFSAAATADSTEPDMMASGADSLSLEQAWLDATAAAELEPGAEDDLDELDRRVVQTQFETARYELVLAHNEQLARNDAEYERELSELRAEIANLNKQVRMQEVRLRNRVGTDQTRVGDLEAQTDALEIELASLRQTLEAERIAHTKRLTEERGAADRALDNARRQYREELAKHVHTHRQALADHRADLDNELAEDRSKQAAALESHHAEYEQQVEIERGRADSKIAAAEERHQKELADLQAAHRLELDQQATRHKDTITDLRGATETSDNELRDLQKENRMLRVELTSQQKQARHNESENGALVQRLSDEIAIMRGELDSERERNAALRADVLRRSAEAHQAIDRAVEERTAQLAELESSVARQREYADRRVRETSAAAEEQARQAAMREADLTATVSRLKRELAESEKKHGQQ